MHFELISFVLIKIWNVMSFECLYWHERLWSQVRQLWLTSHPLQPLHNGRSVCVCSLLVMMWARPNVLRSRAIARLVGLPGREQRWAAESSFRSWVLVKREGRGLPKWVLFKLLPIWFGLPQTARAQSLQHPVVLRDPTPKMTKCYRS